MLPTADAESLAAAVDAMVLRLLRESAHAVPDELPWLLFEEARRAGLAEAAILLVDVEQTALMPLPPAPPELPPQDIDSTLAGRCYQTEQPLTSAASQDGTVVLWAPLIDGSERLGVLYLRAPALSDRLVDSCVGLAALVAELVVSKSQYGDFLVLARRRRPMTLAAEMRWSLLPPLTFSSKRAHIACVLEPAYEVAGDAFDYAMDGDVLHLAIFDAMGHGLEASRIANLAVGGYRQARRLGLDLAATYQLMDAAMAEQFGDERFVTAQLATLDVSGGTFRWLNAGHPHPLLLRRGRLASELVSEPSVPVGLGGVAGSVSSQSLEPGDALLLFTDGVVEARSPGGERFGQERLVDLTRRALAAQQTLAETVRRLVRSVREHRDGPPRDDATLLFVEWHP
ncbi:MAG TPA: PP2C family protein-serine/threonine phosphatase [Acidimicrobiales bacterium]|nr:PP2C family protein-serine/threonine phosphatase [Acidimicrobiales bacterium]